MTSGPLPDAPGVQAGDVLAGRYRLVRLLGEGGMGVVWEARQLTTDKPVAVKLLKGTDAADAARFLREARVAAGLTHRNIVQVFDYWESDGAGRPVFLVMELLSGETLAARLERVGRLGVDELVSLIAPVAAALRAAHAQGVVHRDLKPENVFVTESGSDDGAVDVKVVDFGLARATLPDAAATAITQTGAVMGTPFYMAPEQVYGDKDVDGRADVWALGAVVWECAAGAKAFTGDNFGQIFRRISQADVRPLSEVAEGAPAWLSLLVGRMLAHDRAARPTMAEVYEALVRGPNTEARVVPSVPPPSASTVRIAGRTPSTPISTLPLPAVATRLTSATSVPPAAAAAPRGARWALWLATVAVAVAAGGAGAIWMSRNNGRQGGASVDLGDVPSALPIAAPPSSSGAPAVSTKPAVTVAPQEASVTLVLKAAPSMDAGRRARPAPSGASSSVGPTAAPARDPLSRGRF